MPGPWRRIQRIRYHVVRYHLLRYRSSIQRQYDIQHQSLPSDYPSVPSPPAAALALLTYRACLVLYCSRIASSDTLIRTDGCLKCKLHDYHVRHKICIHSILVRTVVSGTDKLCNVAVEVDSGTLVITNIDLAAQLS